MNLMEKTQLLWHFISWRVRWNKRDTHYKFKLQDNPKFMGPRDAVALIPDGSVVATSGLGGNQRSSIMFWAIREVFEETARPKDLSFVIIGGHGGRGKVPGTMEEMALDALCTRMFTGHTETFKAFLKLADAGKLELQCMPQGVMSFLLEAQANGEESILTETGVGTFVDPRTGRGTPVLPGVGPQYVSVEGDKLRYTLPKLDVAFFNLPAADNKGNLYKKGAALVGESYWIAKAAKRNGGKVIANVGLLVEEGYDEIYIPAEDVDAVVLYPDTEQTGSVKHRKPFEFLTTGSTMPLEEGLERVRFINNVLKVTPRRTAAELAVGRLAASIFAEDAHPGMHVDIGIGLPEEVSALLHTSGLMNELNMMNESGVFGGVAAPGIFFGAAVNPTEILSSTEAFHRLYKDLDVVILGMLQADSAGNVNVSKRGEGAINYVGPGGFVDLTCIAKTLIFVGSWMAHGEIVVENGEVHIKKQGVPKFVEQVEEITFNGRQALGRGCKIVYVTQVGAFRLTERGMELMRVMPGVDIDRDILGGCPMKIVLPEDTKVPVVSKDIVTGTNFRLVLGGKKAGA